MSTMVKIKQDKKLIKKIGLRFLTEWLKEQKLSFGVPNEMFVLVPYEGESDIREQLFVIYQAKQIGRGINFFMDESYNIELTLNYPGTQGDIDLFYTLIQNICKNFNFTSFFQDERIYSLNQIEKLKEDCMVYNQKMLMTSLDENLVVFGAIYPITIEKSFMKKIKNGTNKQVMQKFTTYLHEKQVKDCYYAKPMIYQKGEEDKLYAYYTLTEGVSTIFPLVPFLPKHFHLPENKEISEWNIRFLGIKDSHFYLIGRINFNNMNTIFHFKHCPKFDENHVIITLEKKQIQRLEKMEHELLK